MQQLQVHWNHHLHSQHQACRSWKKVEPAKRNHCFPKILPKTVWRSIFLCECITPSLVFSVLAKENGDDTALCRPMINPKTVWRSIFPRHTQPYVFSALAINENGDNTALQTTLLHFFSDTRKVLQVHTQRLHYESPNGQVVFGLDWPSSFSVHLGWPNAESDSKHHTFHQSTQHHIVVRAKAFF